MIKGKDFVFTGLQPWDIPIGSNAKDIALEVSKNNRVLYINAPRKGIGKYKLNRITNSLWTLDIPIKKFPINFLPDGRIFDFVNRFNQKRMLPYIKLALKTLSFDNPVLFIDNDIYNSFYMPELIDNDLSIYYRRDNMISSYWKKHAPRLEPLLIGKCNLVVTNSIQLAESVSRFNENVHSIGQGMDLEKYNISNKYIMPEDMNNIPKPIIGYAGWVTSRRLDDELIYQIALNCPSYSFVMVGGEDEFFQKNKLHSLNNVIFLGQKKDSEIPNYIYNFDVCFNPQKVNDITIGNYPRKVDEYLALGKPVIATKTKAMEMFENYVFNCNGAEEYIKAINTALNDNSVEKTGSRIEFAMSHSWANTVNALYSHINIKK